MLDIKQKKNKKAIFFGRLHHIHDALLKFIQKKNYLEKKNTGKQRKSTIYQPTLILQC